MSTASENKGDVVYQGGKVGQDEDENAKEEEKKGNECWDDDT